MYENRRFPLPAGRMKFDMRDYASDVPLHNNNATVVQGKIYNTPGNTPLNEVRGPLVELPGKYVWKGDPFK